MPSTDPLWYCHECHAEMRPLMTPEAVCASCHGSFVEKMENPEDDPREFAHADDGGLFGAQEAPPGLDTFLHTLQALMDRGMENDGPHGTNRGPTRPDGSSAASRFSFQISSNNGTRSLSFGGPNTLGVPPRRNSHGGGPPTASEFLGPRPAGQGGPTGDRITGPMMAQYLLALLGNRDPLSSMLAGGMAGGPESGRMGDYVFNQEALDQIITQLMENSNAHRPVPATEEIMAKLPREILMEKSATLELDCAVCKEQFKLNTEDPDEQIVVSLPCKHPFHEPCIIPWLKSSGTCPVCRFALIPQPNNPGAPGADGSPSTSASSPNRTSPPPRASPLTSNRPAGQQGGGFIQSLFGAFGHHPNSSSSPSANQRPPSASPPRSPPQSRSNTGDRRSTGDRSQDGSTHHRHLPGGWADDLD